MNKPRLILIALLLLVLNACVTLSGSQILATQTPTVDTTHVRDAGAAVRNSHSCSTISIQTPGTTHSYPTHDTI
jgi:hypothetical protein